MEEVKVVFKGGLEPNEQQGMSLGFEFRSEVRCLEKQKIFNFSALGDAEEIKEKLEKVFGGTEVTQVPGEYTFEVSPKG